MLNDPWQIALGLQNDPDLIGRGVAQQLGS